MNDDLIQKLPDEMLFERSCNYKQLMGAIQRAKAMGLNRQLPAHIVKRLDPQGTHTFGAPLPVHDQNGDLGIVHDLADGKPAPPHIRSHAFIKLRGRKEAFEQALDIPVACWRMWTAHAPRDS